MIKIILLGISYGILCSAVFGSITTLILWKISHWDNQYNGTFRRE